MNHSLPIHGMLSQAQLKKLVAEAKIDTVIVAFTDHYGRLLGKRCDAEYFVAQSARPQLQACDYLLTTDMEMTPIAGYHFANWEKGYGDFTLVPDWHTLRMVSWLDRTALVLCDVQDEATHQLVEIAPRSILRRQVEKAAALKMTAMAGDELEYYLFQDSYRALASGSYHTMTPLGWYLEDYHILQGTREEIFNAEARRHLKNSGIPVELSKGEWGRGQHEINIRYGEILTMADRHCLFKQCLKELADQKNMSVTFMAKPHHDWAGSSCHIHISLWRQGKNLFVGRRKMGRFQASDVFLWFLGGWLAHVPEMMVFYAPTINSYKRYQIGSWAPTRLGWSYDNRTAGFRVVGHDQNLRIECRIPGADCNPYLALAASLASGLDGIKNRIAPPEPIIGDSYQAQNASLVPRSLSQAVALFETSPFAKEAFGEPVVEHYAHFFHTEIEAFAQNVTDWERERYFEQI